MIHLPRANCAFIRRILVHSWTLEIFLVQKAREGAFGRVCQALMVVSFDALDRPAALATASRLGMRTTVPKD
jgi:hypothetical protein